MKIKHLVISALFSLVFFASFAQSEIINSADTTAFLSTDKCCYKPGDTIVFTLVNEPSSNVRMRYKYLNDKIADLPLNHTTWTWKAPAKDYTGYLVELYSTKNGQEKIISTIGVDVSSDWKKFPRYGFVSQYPAMSDETAALVVNDLNRFHINGLQFYDWQYKHHKPLAGTVQHPDTFWKDIGGREIHASAIRGYIKAAHQKQMRTMFYDLAYGTYENAEADGVSPKWYLYADSHHNKIEKFELAKPPFISDLLFTDPSNIEWQQYLVRQNRDVYSVYDFDGYHIDQVGNRDKNLYKYNGSLVDVSKTFELFVNSMKKQEPLRPLVMNAVNQYGQEGIAKTNVEFLYTEVWPPNEGFDGLAKVILDNNKWSNNRKNTVLTAYIHFVEGQKEKGFYNTPAVLLADAVIFAFGGSHLELGEHMLGAPYFPEDFKQMKDDLKAAIIPYYDFLVAYQNVLRDGGKFSSPSLQCLNNIIQISAWPAKIGHISFIGKEFEKRQVIHLLNFTNAATLEWRDTKQIQKEPALINNIQLNLKTNKHITRLWFASPDINKGAAQKISFIQANDKIRFTIPSLKYWDMVVAEYQ